jgi:hypothetical protein
MEAIVAKGFFGSSSLIFSAVGVAVIVLGAAPLYAENATDYVVQVKGKNAGGDGGGNGGGNGAGDGSGTMMGATAFKPAVKMQKDDGGGNGGGNGAGDGSGTMMGATSFKPAINNAK